jgi:hypothetical protein
MLHRVLSELESAEGAVDLGEMAQRLGVERTALEGMIEFWVRKGRLRSDRPPGAGPGTERRPPLGLLSGPHRRPPADTEADSAATARAHEATEAASASRSCHDTGCGRSCAGSADCPFVIELPRRIWLVPRDED